MWIADFKIAISSLSSTKTRTFLTVMGIVIGVGSVTTILAMGQGIQNSITNQATQFNGEVATVRPGQLLRDNNGNVQSYDLFANFNAGSLTEEDVKTVSSTPGVVSAAPIMGLRGTIISDAQAKSNAQIIATNDQLTDVLSQNMRAGQFIDPSINNNTIVFGSGLANKLLGTTQSIGQMVKVRGQEFTLIGILDTFKMPLAVNGLYDANNAAYVPIEAGKNMNQGIAQVQTINFRINKSANKDEVIQLVEKRLIELHGANDVAVIGTKAARQIIDNFFINVTGYTAAIAAISLLVGGIGVMNIMLVAVTERTREIGIRKAVGATNGQIMRQFLIESVVMSLSGGLIGLGAAATISFFIDLQFNIPTAFSLEVMSLGLGVSVIVGILFGMFPALRAARKDPIAALRQI